MNAQSIVNKTDQLELVLLKYDPHIAVIPETWFNDAVPDDDIITSPHNIIRRDRVNRGGGVAIIVKKPIKITLLEQISEHEFICES